MKVRVLWLLAAGVSIVGGCEETGGVDGVGEPTREASEAIVCSGYTVTDLGAVAGSYVASGAYGISPNGTVTGQDHPVGSWSVQKAFSWTSAGGLTDVGTLGGSTGIGSAVNDAGQIAGTAYLAGDVNQHAFFYDPATGMHDLGTFGGDGFAGSTAYGINASGSVAGVAQFASGYQHAFVSTNGGALVDLGVHPTGYNSEARAINDAGVVVGRADGVDGYDRAAKWENGVLSDLGALGGTSIAYAVNNAGAAVGEASVGGGWVPVVFANGAVTEIPLPDGFDRGVAYGIGDNGQVVGELWPTFGSGSSAHHAFVSQGDTTYDLNDLVTDHSITFTSARAINAAGQIVGYGSGAVDGTLHGFLLTPNTCGGSPAFGAIATAIDTTTVDAPAGVATGNLLIAALEVDADPVVVTPPLGWTLVRDQLAGAGTDQAFHALVYQHVATTTEPTSYTFDVPEGVYIDIQVAAYTGVSAVDVSAGASATGTSIAAPSVTTSQANEMLVAVYIDFAGGSWTRSSGLTRRSNFDANSLQDALIAAAGPTGAHSASCASGALAAISLALK